MTGMKYSYRLVDMNNRKVCIVFCDNKWELVTKTLGRSDDDQKEWTETRDRLSEDDIGNMNFQMMRLFSGPAIPSPTAGEPIVTS